MKHMKLFFLTCCLFFAAASGMRAQTSIDYIDADGIEKTATAIAITSTIIELNDGWYYVPENTIVPVNGRITVSGSANIILEDGCEFTVTGGIRVQGNDDQLTIYGQSLGTGRLTAQATTASNAGIGSNNSNAGGTIIINGGTVTATGGSDGAGIGGGYDGISGGSGGTITINGGTVTATSTSGAGIGGGRNGSGGDITINGGVVKATSNRVGIGGDGTTITINDGTVTATGGYEGIGGSGSTIAINDGAVEATGSQPNPGIGGRYGASITISGGTVKATGGGLAAGIGSGGNNSSGATTITISGGTVTAIGGSNGAGIGSGNNSLGSAVTITGGTIKATGNGGGKDIGPGNVGTGGTVILTGGSIQATNISPLPTNGIGAVYLNTLTLDGVAAITEVTAGSINGTACDNTPVAANGVYGIKDVTTDATGNVYFYLPASGNSGANAETIRLTAGINYKGTFARPANSTTAKTLITAAILGVTSPAAGATPDATITATDEYTGTVAWTPAEDPFGYATAYTATITLAAKSGSGYTFAGFTDDASIAEFTVNGIAPKWVSNGDTELVLKVTFPKTEYAPVTDIEYLDENGDLQTATGVTAITSSTIFPLTDGWYYVQGPLAVGTRITVSGDVHIILADGCDFIIDGGIQVQGSNNQLTIYGQSDSANTGKLTVENITGGDAGIGSNNGNAGGTIIINGGTVTATGNSSGAGIGGGYYGSGGTITINGGTVTATGTYGAGIGGGYNGSGGTITINGGTVTATGDSYSAGIGRGYNGPSGSGSVTLTGGSVQATSTNGAGISPPPTNGNGENVYLNTLELDGVSAVTPIAAGSINGTPCDNTPNAATGVYGIKDVTTDAAGNVYFYLPASGNGGADTETILLADGSNNYYEGTFARAPGSAETLGSIGVGVTAAAIDGITAPVAGATAPATVTPTTEYTGAVLWNPADASFGYATTYTATITLAAETGYTLAGFTDDASIANFTVDGITPTRVSNSDTELEFTVTFPATAPPPTYGITVGSFTGGSVSANTTLAAAGETVMLTVYPASGYELSAISVFKTGYPTVSVGLNGFNGLNGLNGDFIMPDYDVTVSASFSENLPPEPDPDAVALDGFIYTIRNLHVTVPQEEANTESEVAVWLKAYLARLFEDKGWDISVQTLTVVNFFPATAGTRTDVPGTNGSFSFFATLRKGYVTDRTYNMDGTVTATPYTIPVGNESVEVGTSVYFRNHTLYICSPVAETVEVYSFSGERIFSARKDAGEAAFTVPANLKAVIVRGSSGWTQKTINN
ncbi:hypothetical protein FACS1894181_05060 [Bacteroidia bacterium]|nr:hypothetical protein FACS1894181_05060 [Bacteroidia bacterium]